MERDIVSLTGKDIMMKIIVQNQAKLTDQLDLKNVIQLDNQSTLDLICNKKLTSKIKKSDKKISVQENGGTLAMKYRSRIPGSNYEIWYSKDAITNIISLKNMIRHYYVTYHNDDQTFIVHREAYALPDIEFRMHKSGLHLLYQEDTKKLLLMNTAEENMKAFTKRDIEGAKESRKLYTKLLFMSNGSYQTYMDRMSALTKGGKKL